MLRGVPFDVLVVLGCRVQGEALVHASLRRVERAAQVYAEQGAGLVVASGGKLWQGFRECEVFAAGLRALGVPPERVLEERASLTTRGNACGVAELLRERVAGRVGLVTCDFHMPRALRLFRRVGIAPVALPAPSPARPLPLRAARLVRENLSLAIDLALAPLWLRT